MANDNIEMLSLAERQGARVAFTPVDVRSNSVRHSEHVGTDVDADDTSAVAKPFLCYARNDPGSASNVEDAVAFR
nr:hypothetical protein [Ensifer sp. BR816]